MLTPLLLPAQDMKPFAAASVRDYADEQRDETDPVILKRLDEWQVL